MMIYAAIARRMTAALGLGLISTAAFAGGYGGGSYAHSAMAPQEAQAILAYADDYSDGSFRVRHTEGGRRVGKHRRAWRNRLWLWFERYADRSRQRRHELEAFGAAQQRLCRERFGERHRILRQLRQGALGRRQILHLQGLCQYQRVGWAPAALRRAAMASPNL